MHDHSHAAELLRRALPGITIHICRDPEQAWIDEMIAETRREYEEHERDLDTAERLGMRPTDDHDERHGNVLAICEGCREDWPHGLEVIGGAALCSWCIDALLDDGPDGRSA